MRMWRPVKSCNVIYCFYILQIYKCYDYLREIQFKKAKIKAKKKPRRRSDSSGGYTLSDIIQSPPAAGTQHHSGGCLSSHFSSVHSIFKNYIVVIKQISLLSVISPSMMKSEKVNSNESLQELLTSDSEGSCMGVGSPRDILSPIFHDKTEVNCWQGFICWLHWQRSMFMVNDEGKAA